MEHWLVHMREDLKLFWVILFNFSIADVLHFIGDLSYSLLQNLNVIFYLTFQYPIHQQSLFFHHFSYYCIVLICHRMNFHSRTFKTL